MTPRTDDLRILELKELVTPEEVITERPLTDKAADTVTASRRAISDILHGHDDRLVVVAGPCSIHDPVAAIDYARRLAALRGRHKDALEIVMRVYFEKPRTTVGWKGLINDPMLDGSFDINRGLRLARGVLADINALGLPAACEFLDMTTPQYLSDLVAWAAIGARTTESQVHREMASGLSCPIGFKNGTSGNIQIAVDAVQSAGNPHHFLAVTKSGRAAIAATGGNPDCHVILRGGTRGTNYDTASIDAACAASAKAGVPQSVMIDASHANSGKKHENQALVLEDIGRRIAAGERRIMGVMAESFLVEGSQSLKPGATLHYGQSVTDACMGWETTLAVLDGLAASVRARRDNRRRAVA
jgi:3-deoxy-7-phosphoheptulonate synthase